MARSITIEQLPPYGFINREWMEDVRETPMPPDFVLGNTKPTQKRYEAWVAALADEIADNLWPVFDRKVRKWRGKATRSAIKLTEADLELLDTLKLNRLRLIAARPPGPTKDDSHEYFFKEEDNSVPDVIDRTLGFRKFGASYGKYDGALPVGLSNKVRADFQGKGMETSGELDLQLKQHLQRPRAYQVAFLLGRQDYAYEWARTAVSPSLVSGHCLDASISGCHAYLKCQRELEGIDGAERYWAQFTVDMGDRRVFAGVHYPSDNISSWFVALRLAWHVFRPPSRAKSARDFLWQAIKQSAVYRAIDSAAQAGDSPYADPLKWLAAEAARRQPST